MPITPAHVAAVLPLLGRRRAWVVPAAWVVGAMSPDLVYFAPVGNVRSYSHSLLGLLTVDLALGALLLVAWWAVVGEAARDLLPAGARRRVARPEVPRGRWGWVVVGLVGGSVTHVVWDAFTHRDGWGSRLTGLRDAVWAGQPATSVLQDASGVSACSSSSGGPRCACARPRRWSRTTGSSPGPSGWSPSSSSSSCRWCCAPGSPRRSRGTSPTSSTPCSSASPGPSASRRSRRPRGRRVARPAPPQVRFASRAFRRGRAPRSRRRLLSGPAAARCVSRVDPPTA